MLWSSSTGSGELEFTRLRLDEGERDALISEGKVYFGDKDIMLTEVNCDLTEN